MVSNTRPHVIVPDLAQIAALLDGGPLVACLDAVVEAGTVARVGHVSRHAVRRKTHVATFVCTSKKH